MKDPTSISSLLLLAAAGVLPLASAGCPYIKGNGDSQSQSGPNLHARYDDAGPGFGQCSRKSKVAGGGTRSDDWWPCELSLDVLRQNTAEVNPHSADFEYAQEFAKIDVVELKKDLTALQKNSQPWWPADYGDYGPFFVRLAWHNSGTYRQIDGRGGNGRGQQRFAPLNSWPDNASLDKARRLLWPIKQKYGRKLSWADLFVFAGNNAMENMGFPTYGFGFGRVDTWQADEGIYWGSEDEFFPSNKSDYGRYNGSTDIFDRADDLEAPLANSNMGLIYVDPRGPHGIPDTKASALDTRMTFGRMGMNDEETVALIAGGHAFGKTHGAVSGDYIGPEPNAAGIEEQGLGWKNNFQSGVRNNTYTSGLEVIWTKTPTKWSNEFLKSLLHFNYTLVKSPAGSPQWEALDHEATYPDAFIDGKFHRPTLLTSDLGLRDDPIYHNISQTYYNDFDGFTQKFALAWYKLLHRDMGPLSRYLGPEVPKEDPLIWQDPLPSVNYKMISDEDVDHLKEMIMAQPSLNVSSLITTAWGSASTFRISDKRGGANGGRIALEPQRSFAVNNPARLDTVLPALRAVQDKFNADCKDKQVSLADLIVLGGNAAIEKASKDAGTIVQVPFTPGRIDTTQDLTDVDTFAYLEPQADGFRNYGHRTHRSMTEEFMVDRASLLTLTPPEMTVLVGGMRALDANYDGSKHGVFTERPGQLTNDYFMNLLNISTVWTPMENTRNEMFQGKDMYSGEDKHTATRADLIFGSHPELRAVAEVYGSEDAQDKMVHDFVAAWVKVSDLDRYDARNCKQKLQG